jgi:hypothetical protein
MTLGGKRKQSVGLFDQRLLFLGHNLLLLFANKYGVLPCPLSDSLVWAVTPILFFFIFFAH